jgi:hypothetical protein
MIVVRAELVGVKFSENDRCDGARRPAGKRP